MNSITKYISKDMKLAELKTDSRIMDYTAIFEFDNPGFQCQAVAGTNDTISYRPILLNTGSNVTEHETSYTQIHTLLFPTPSPNSNQHQQIKLAGVLIRITDYLMDISLSRVYPLPRFKLGLGCSHVWCLYA